MSSVPALASPPIASLLLDLQQSGALTVNSLVLTDPDMTLDRAIALCRYFGTVIDSGQWWVGDLLLYLEQVFPEKFSQLSEELNISPDTRARWMRVSERIPPDQRHPQLRWSHHFVVCHLGYTERTELLAEAAKKGWSKRQLVEEVKEDSMIQEPEVCRCDRCGHEHKLK